VQNLENYRERTFLDIPGIIFRENALLGLDTNMVSVSKNRMTGDGNVIEERFPGDTLFAPSTGLGSRSESPAKLTPIVVGKFVGNGGLR